MSGDGGFVLFMSGVSPHWAHHTTQLQLHSRSKILASGSAVVSPVLLDNSSPYAYLGEAYLRRSNQHPIDHWGCVLEIRANHNYESSSSSI